MSKTILKDRSGVGTIELALTIPLFLILAFGIFEFGRAIYAKNVIINMSREGANLYSRDARRPQYIMDALALTSESVEMQNSGMIYLTKVEGTSDGPKIIEQEAWDDKPADFDPPSRIGPAPPESGPPPNANVDDLVLLEGEIAYVVEVFYNYNVVFSDIIDYDDIEIYAMSAF